ncbi:hypothetical protein ACJDT4_13985 [Clostridium neuense]|uniref:DUF4134 domain-containing protein n=1 Tax=Clostridium neuense TaxID=1728934 RepID=A0ABW8TI85_9CLOT
MIKEKFKKFNGNAKKMWLKASTIAVSAGAVIMTSSMRVFAADSPATGGATSITSQDASTVASRIFTANQGMATAFGGALVGIAVVVIGIKMLMASKKQEARSEAMDSVLTVIIAALLLGGFAVFAGLFWGWGTK